MGETRDIHRAEHREWVKSGGNGLAVVLVGSALLDGNGDAIGHFGILSALNEADARAFAEGDPYAVGGAVETIELTPLPDTFQAHRIAEPMTVSGRFRAREISFPKN